MLYTRRDLGKSALASLPLTGVLKAAKVDSVFDGIQFGIITYSFNRIASPDPEAIIKACVDFGLGEVELMSNHGKPSHRCSSIALDDYEAAGWERQFSTAKPFFPLKYRKHLLRSAGTAWAHDLAEFPPVIFPYLQPQPFSSPTPSSLSGTGPFFLPLS